MNIQFYFKKMETSPALIAYTRSKLEECIHKYSDGINALITFKVVDDQHQVTCRMKSGRRPLLNTVARCPNMYGSVDLLVQKLDNQLKRQKEKLKSHKINGTLQSVLFERGISYQQNTEDDGSIDAEEIVRHSALNQSAL